MILNFDFHKRPAPFLSLNCSKIMKPSLREIFNIIQYTLYSIIEHSHFDERLSALFDFLSCGLLIACFNDT